MPIAAPAAHTVPTDTDTDTAPTVPAPRGPSSVEDVAPLMSSYLTDGVHQDRFSLTGIDLAPASVAGTFRLDGYGVSPEDAGGFHLTAPTVFRMAGQLVVVHTHWLGGLAEKAVEVWVRDHQMRHVRSSRDPERVPVTMSLTAARTGTRHPQMLRVEYDALVDSGAVVGRTTTFVDFSPRPDALEHARLRLQQAGVWADA